MSPPLLFAHVSWMPNYLGVPGEPMFSTHGYVIENKIGHERWNYRSENDLLFGYVPIRGKELREAPGEIRIENLGASRHDKTIEGVTVVWFANSPSNARQAYIVGWYRDATVFREAQFRDNREFRMSCRKSDATLLAENVRNFPIPHVRSLRGREIGYGYGQSSVWYATNAPDSFLQSVNDYINAIDEYAERGPDLKICQVGDAIDDLDDTGNAAPEKRRGTSTFFVRDPEVRRQVIARANGQCEFCGELGFERIDGSHFIEAHHIIHLAKQGPDTLDNVIALCPNHHREAHFGKDGESFEVKLKAQLRAVRGK